MGDQLLCHSSSPTVPNIEGLTHSETLWVSVFPLKPLYNRLCCSKRISVAIVCGPSRTKPGVHPRKTHLIPSAVVSSFTTCNIPCLLEDPINWVLTTSIGLHSVVATSAAKKDADKCKPGWSLWIPVVATIRSLKVSYDASWQLVIIPQRKAFGHNPCVKAFHPSCRLICLHASKMCR